MLHDMLTSDMIRTVRQTCHAIISSQRYCVYVNCFLYFPNKCVIVTIQLHSESITQRHAYGKTSMACVNSVYM